MPGLSDVESRLLAEVSRDRLWQHAETLARWERISSTPGESAAVDYLQQQLRGFGLETERHEFESLVGWPEDAAVEVRAPIRRQCHALTHSFTPSTDPGGREAEVVYLGSGEAKDFVRQPIRGKIALIDGMPAPVKVLRGQRHGAAGQIYVQTDRILHDLCVSPVWGTPTPRTAELLPTLPLASISRSDGDEIKALLEHGTVVVCLRTKTFWDWRKILLLIGQILGQVEPEKFVLFSGHHCSWYYGAMDNGTANATMLEVARILAAHRNELRRSVRFAFWPGHTQGRYSGSTWYFDNFWEDLHDNCILHVNVDSTGARGATIYQALSMPETRDFALAAVHDAIGVEAEPERQSRAGDQSFWGCGVPSVFMDLSQVPSELAANMGSGSLFRAPDQAPARQPGGLPWWWHTPEDTLDKIDPDVLARDTRVYLLTNWRSASAPILPFRYGTAAREIRESLERYGAEAGDRFDLGPAIDRARRVEVVTTELDHLLDGVRGRADAEQLAAVANRGGMAINRALVTINFTANGPFDQDLAVPIPAIPLLEPSRRLKEMDPATSETRFLVTELTRNRNKVVYYLQQALTAAEGVVTALRAAI
jgi:hypothetical protein